MPVVFGRNETTGADTGCLRGTDAPTGADTGCLRDRGSPVEMSVSDKNKLALTKQRQGEIFALLGCDAA